MSKGVASGGSNIDGNVVGDIVTSMLSEAQFQSLRNTNWVLMDGRDVSGSKYAQITGDIAIPDARGVFLRGKNNGRSDGSQNPSGELDLGTFENDAFQGHWHTSNGFNGGGAGAASARWDNPTTNPQSSNIRVTNAVTDGVNGTPRTASETRPKNITINYFIKIN